MLDIQLEEIAFSDIRADTGYPMLQFVQISDIRYLVILRSGVHPYKLLYIHLIIREKVIITILRKFYSAHSNIYNSK